MFNHSKEVVAPVTAHIVSLAAEEGLFSICSQNPDRFRSSTGAVRSDSGLSAQECEGPARHKFSTAGATLLMEIYRRQPALDDSSMYMRFRDVSGDAPSGAADTVRAAIERMVKEIKEFEKAYRK
ncbi:hypothetical protein TruAng_010251 [Truncatella angustata]|nr:hypothetical protein TruAng_010251 [Truncatella angustata]